MSSEHALKTVVAFNKMPKTPETEEIKRQYLVNEIGSYEFYEKASKYLKEQDSEVKS